MISIAVRVESLTFFGQDVSRPWLVELRDTDSAHDGFLWSSVWFTFDEISQASTGGWTTFSVTFDPNSTELPDGWGGFGNSDDFDGPSLPDGITFRDVLADVDMLAFTTLQPGLFFGFTDHTVGIDNISITRVVPAPSALALLGLGRIVGTRRRR